MNSVFEINNLFNSAADSRIGFIWPSFNFPFFDFPVHDVINGDDGNNDLQISGSGNILNGGNGDDSLSSGFIGGNNILNGDGGNDHITSSGMNDQLDGGDGNDFLIAYRSSTLIGGNGADVFNLSVNGVGIGLPESISTIKDFQDGIDRLKLPQIPIAPLTVPGSQVIAPPGTNVTNFMIGPVTNGRPAAFEELTMLQQGANTEIRFGNDILAVLEGIQASQITPEDFIPADSLVGAVNVNLGVTAQDELSLAASRSSEIARQEYGQLEHGALNASNNFIDFEDVNSLGARAGLTADLFPLIDDFNDYSGLQAAVDNYSSLDSSLIYLG